MKYSHVPILITVVTVVAIAIKWYYGAVARVVVIAVVITQVVRVHRVCVRVPQEDVCAVVAKRAAGCFALSIRIVLHRRVVLGLQEGRNDASGVR
jgi:hypothetical protein